MLTNYRFPKYMNKEKTLIDILVDHKDHGTIPFSTKKGEELFARVEKGEFGRIKEHVEIQYSPEHLKIYTDLERIRRVNEAYITEEKRHSAYGYLAKLSHIPKEQLTEEQKKDIETLHAADEWETEMIERVPIIVQQNSKDAIRRDNAWPKCKVAKALRELCEQC